MQAEHSPITRIVDLLDAPEAYRRAAAAVVLEALAPEDEVTLEALRRAVRRADDPDLRRRAAEAIGAIAPKSIVNDLRPLLKDAVVEVREAAQAVLASGRGVTAEDVARMLEAKDDRQRVSAIAVLGAMGTREARRSILTQLSEGSPRIYEAVRDALEPLLPKLEGPEAEAEVEAIAARIDRARLAEDEKLGLTVVSLLSLVPHEGAAGPLLDLCRSSAPIAVRSAAMAALRTVVQGRKPGQRVFKELLELVEEPGTPKALLGPATDTLAVLDVPLALEPRVRKLLSADETVVRRWALRGLGRLDSAPAAKALVEALLAGDATDREIALEAALGTTNGKNALAKALGKLTEPDKAELIARGLRPHLGNLLQATLHHLEEAALEATPEVAGVVMSLLKGSGGQNAGRAQEGLFDKALKLKRDGKLQEAADLFKRISSAGVDAEARYQLGVCELLLSKRKLARGANADPCLATLGGLSRARDFSLLDRLRQEPGVDEDALYYLGFSLAEGSEGAQGLGGDLLMAVAESEGNAKLARMARNKLMTMGWME